MSWPLLAGLILQTIFPSLPDVHKFDRLHEQLKVDGVAQMCLCVLEEDTLISSAKHKHTTSSQRIISAHDIFCELCAKVRADERDRCTDRSANLRLAVNLLVYSPLLVHENRMSTQRIFETVITRVFD